jgi:Ca2+-binding EF-hand superfamily protein
MVLINVPIRRTFMFKRSLIAALILLPAIGYAADNPIGAKATRSVSRFSRADTDGNGKLSRAEVGKAMPQLSGRFDSIDTDRDGQLSRGELRAWMKAHKGERQAKAAERFKHADTDGDGAISRAEAEQHAPRLAQKFDLIDSNKDGKLTQEELRAYREARRKQKDRA